MSEATLMTDGTQSTPAATSTATADTANTTATADAAGNNADATQQPANTDAAQADNAGDTNAQPKGDAPEEYEFVAPEGVTFDTELVGEFKGIAKELKMSQADAQKVTNLGAKMAQKFEARQNEAFQTVAAEWAAAATTDPEFGGDKLQENLVVAKKAMDAFGTPELRELLEKSRFGNHPEVIRFMCRAGKAISEDRMVTGGNSNVAVEKKTSDILYGNS